jgi:hypothetical protein
MSDTRVAKPFAFQSASYTVCGQAEEHHSVVYSLLGQLRSKLDDPNTKDWAGEVQELRVKAVCTTPCRIVILHKKTNPHNRFKDEDLRHGSGISIIPLEDGEAIVYDSAAVEMGKSLNEVVVYPCIQTITIDLQHINLKLKLQDNLQIGDIYIIVHPLAKVVASLAPECNFIVEGVYTEGWNMIRKGTGAVVPLDIFEGRILPNQFQPGKRSRSAAETDKAPTKRGGSKKDKSKKK